MPKSRDARDYDSHDHYFLNPKQREELKAGQVKWRRDLVLKESLKEKIKNDNPLAALKEAMSYLNDCINKPSTARKFDVHLSRNILGKLMGIKHLVKWEKIKTFEDLQTQYPRWYEILIRNLNKIIQ